MSSRTRVFSSSVGTKLLIGGTGVALFLYLLIHIFGNLMVFAGQAAFNKYAYTLESNPLLPLIELGLLAVFATHIYKTVRMYLSNQQARPTPYVQKKGAGGTSRKSLASSTMIVSGLWLLLFLIVHVKAFRFGVEYEWPAGGRDLYTQELENLRSPLTAAFYVVSMVIVGSHLVHGSTSAFQSLGFQTSGWSSGVRSALKALSVLIAAGFIVIAILICLKANGSL